MDYENFKEELIEGLKENFEARGIEGMSFRNQRQVNKKYLNRKLVLHPNDEYEVFEVDKN